MKNIICTIAFGLFLFPCFLIGAEKEPSEAEKKQREENAARFAQIAASFGGKMIEKKDKPKMTVLPLTEMDIRARL